jgi:hypothetical protein
MPETGTGADGALEELDALLLAIAGGGAVGRGEAMRWSHCRALLLDSAYRDHLPGFVLQCGSVHKFREFITLYDALPTRRVAFLRAAMGPARAMLGDRPAGAAAPLPDARRRWSF